MPRRDWLVVGIGGATCSGKTTIADKLNKMIPNSVLIKQDDFFLDEHDSRHTIVPELNHVNFEIMSSLNMDAMLEQVDVILNKQATIQTRAESEDMLKYTGYIPKEGLNIPNTLIIEGFLIFNHQVLRENLNLKYFITLEKDVCWERRKIRVYTPPDPPGYFDLCVWPHYLTNLDEIKQLNDDDMVFLNGANDNDQTTKIILNHYLKFVQDTWPFL